MNRILLIGALLFGLKTFSQSDSSQQVISLNLDYGQIYAHSVAVRNVKGAKPFHAELEFSLQKLSQKIFENCNCYPKTGFQLTYINFGTSILGEGFAVSHFIEPQYKISPKLQFRIKGSIGAIYLTRPFDPIKHPDNNSYAIHLNPYFNVGGGFSVKLDQHLSLAAMGFFHHTSNSGIKQPNRGINWLTGALSLQYSTQSAKLPTFSRSYNRYWRKVPIQFEAGVLFSPHQGYNSRLGIERNYVLGGFLQATKQVGRISGIIAGAEAYSNHFVQHPQPLKSNTVIGVQAGHAFLLGKTTFTTQIGVDIFNKTITKTNYYTRFGFNYKFGDHIRFGAALKAQADYADFADLRLSYIF